MMIGLDKNTFGNPVSWKWYAIIEEFDLKVQAEKMKQNHPHWSERQCKNLLYWQNSVRKRLRDKAIKYKTQLSKGYSWIGFLLEIPEAQGINVFATMEKVGIILCKNPDIVRKIMFVGVPLL